MHHACKGEPTLPSLTDIRNLMTAEWRLSGWKLEGCVCWRSHLTNWEEHLKSKGTRVHAPWSTNSWVVWFKCAIPNLQPLTPPDAPDSSKLRGQRHRKKCVETGECVFRGKQTHHLLWKPLLKIYLGCKCYCYPNWTSLVSFGMEHIVKMAYLLVTHESAGMPNISCLSGNIKLKNTARQSPTCNSNTAHFIWCRGLN